jgi:hypothetical protein
MQPLNIVLDGSFPILVRVKTRRLRGKEVIAPFRSFKRCIHIEMRLESMPGAFRIIERSMLASARGFLSRWHAFRLV